MNLQVSVDGNVARVFDRDTGRTTRCDLVSFRCFSGSNWLRFELAESADPAEPRAESRDREPARREPATDR